MTSRPRHNSCRRYRTWDIRYPKSPWASEVMLQTSYEKACSDRRGSAPATPVLGLRTMDTTTPSRFANFFSKRSFKSNPLKRTKSVTKLERKRCTIDGDCVPPSRLRTSRSHESLLQSSPSSLATLDLSHGDVQVSALHCSLLGQDNCFQMVSNGGTRFYTCRTKEERDRWLYSLKKTIQPNQDSVRRKENSLRIWILEAKGIIAKKSRYYCELCLDKTLYARTSSKQKGDMCFWGEHFEFSSLPAVETICVNLYREADKKKRRDKNVHIGSVQIPVSSINGRHLLEKWYAVTPEKVAAGKDIPSIRIKSRFQTIEILPLVVYKDLLRYLKSEYKITCEMLEPVISVRAKEDVATTLINIMQKENIVKEFLADVVMSDIEKIGDLHLTFRGNSLATKATEAYMKLLGDKYLQETLGMFLKMVLDSTDDCEVDPMKVTNNTALHRQQSNLMMYVEMVWVKIINSANSFPSELQEVFYEYRKRLANIGKEELCDNLISASIFLRFLCPAILSPSLFNLSQEYPQGKSARNLTLVAKTIQTLANFTRFGGKESFMEFMNGFVEREWITMKSFLRQISSPPSKDFPRRTDFDGYIDLGRELAIMHNLLAETLTKVNQKCYFDQIDKLQNILDCISAALNQPPQAFYKNSNSSTGSPKYDKNYSANMKNITTTQTQTVKNESLDKQPQDHVQSYVGNSIDVRNSENDYHSLAFMNTAQKTTVTVPSSTRPATLPRNAYLMGSAKRPAADLSTSDDYVLYSAFDSSHNSSKENSGLKISTPVSIKRENGSSDRLTQSCIYGEALNNKNSLSNSNGMNVPVYGDLSKKILNDQKPPENSTSPKNGIVLQNVFINSNTVIVGEEPGHDFKKKDCVLHDEDVANSSGEMEVNNAKGSQISIGQLSTMASSGYQSFPYSQSNSPVDLTYQQDESSTPVSALPPLAFNNPMYHFQTSSSSPLWESSGKTQRKNLRLSHLSSLSAEDISMLYRSSGFADSSPLLPMNGCYCSSSSSGTASCNSTPPAERRNSQFKSTAPRTNPRYSGSQHPCHTVCATCSPRLNSRSFSHPIRSQICCLHDGKHSGYGSEVHHRKKKNLNLSTSNFHPKASLNCGNTQESRNHINMKTESCSDALSTIPVQLEDHDRDLCVNSTKKLEDYEQEVNKLRLQMLSLQSKLSDAENKLSKQETATEKVVSDWQIRLEAGEDRIKKQQEEKDHQTRIITRLITVEEELKKEQQKMQGVIIAKQKFIEAQERKIQTLDAANKGLLNALTQLQDRYQLQGRNGTSLSSPNSPSKLAVLENIDGRFKSSSC